MKNENILIINVSTGKYRYFFDRLYKSVIENLLPKANRDFILFRNNDSDVRKRSGIRKVVSIEEEEFPYVSLYRYHYIYKEKEILKDYDIVMYMDADMYVVKRVSIENIQPSKLFAVKHPWYLQKSGPFEDNDQSCAYVPGRRRNKVQYVQGCFWGGRSKFVLEMSKVCSRWTERDMSKGIMPKWHDESYLNKYFVQQRSVFNLLGPEYAYPKDRIEIGVEPVIYHINENSSNILTGKSS